MCKYQLSEDVHFYNPNSTERGPISEKVFEQHPSLFNTYYWYIERTAVTYNAALQAAQIWEWQVQERIKQN